MTEPNESSYATEEAEALSVANELAGGDDWNADDTSGDEPDLSGPGPREGTPAATPTVPGQQQTPTLTLDQARQAWNQQTATRAQLREYANQQYQAAQQQAQERQRYEDMANAILRAQAQQQQPPDAPQIDPELQRYFDQQQQTLLSQVQGMLAPVLSQAQLAQQQQEVQQQVSHEQGQWNEFREIVSRAEQDYMATPEGQGYNERVSGFETALRKTCEYAGLEPRVAQRLVNEDMKGMAVLAMSLNIPPPVFVDAYARAMFEWATGQGQPANGNGQNGNGQPARQQPQRQQARVSPQVQIARMATQNGAVGAPPSSGAAASNGIVTAGDLLGRGLTGTDIDALVKEYGSLDKAIRYLERQAIELEQIEG